MATVDFYYDYVSPYSYLAFTQRQRLADAGAELAHRPFFLGAVLAAIRVAPPITVGPPARQAYLLADLGRWARRYGVAFALPAGFPVNTLRLLRGAGLARERGALDAYSARCFQAVWAEGLAVDQLDVGRGLAADAGLDPQEWAEYVERPEVKAALKAETEAALTRGVFGAPTFFLGDEHFFGNDRLDFLIEALEDRAP